MTTLSVPLTPELAKFVEESARNTGLSKADIMRQALMRYAEEEAVQAVLRASKEPSLDGDLKELLKQV